MATPTPNPVEAGVQGSSYMPPTAWGAVQIGVLAVLAATLALAIVVHVFNHFTNRRRAKAKDAELESAVAELGAERARASELQGALNRRDAFIDRNVLQGPEAFCAVTPPSGVSSAAARKLYEAGARKSSEASARKSSETAARKSYESGGGRQSYESNGNDIFVVGSYSSTYDEEEAARLRAVAARSTVRPSAAPAVQVQAAVRVQPSQIRTVTVSPPKRARVEEPVVPVSPPKRARVEEPASSSSSSSLPSKRARLEEAEAETEADSAVVPPPSPPLPEGGNLWWQKDAKQRGESSSSAQRAPAPRGSLQAELDRYWRDNESEDDEEEEDGGSAEVGETTGRGKSVDKGKGKGLELTQISL